MARAQTRGSHRAQRPGGHRLDLALGRRGHLLPNGTISARFQHLLALAERFAFYATALRAGISHATDVEDAGSAAVYTDISRGVEKRLWFLEAHLHHCGTRAAPQSRDGRKA